MSDTDLILLDGGMGRELQRRRMIAVKTIWSGFALIDMPEAVCEIHGEFLAAGAEVITTSNYGVVPALLAMEDMQARLPELTRKAVEMAQTARDEFSPGARIAGSLPPLNISYRPELVGSDDELLAGYRELAVLLAPGCDILLGETLSTAREGRAVALAALETGREVWISWTLDEAANGRLRSGETLADAYAAVADLPVTALLFNCCSTEAVARALPELRTLTDKPIGAYANIFKPLGKDYVMGAEGEVPLREDMPPAAYLKEAERWRSMGATIIGGCCGIGPGTIAMMAEAFGKPQPR